MLKPHESLVSAAWFALALLPSSGFAQTQGPDLSQASIEELMRIEITSVARKEQRAADVAAAVFVITQDDIRRSGMTTIPDLLRLAPGVQVAQINSNKWAVSVRGFNGLYANKLLVLVDGRSVYNRIFSGVLWDAEDLMLDDIDRIEVIRGPGAAIWGANAVNGVINIVTKTTAATEGALARVEAGRFGEQAAVRYGGAHYRVYAQWTGRNQSLTSRGAGADDASRRATTGFRADWTRGPSALMLEGSLSAGRARALWPNLDPLTAASQAIAREPSDSQGGHLLARWTRTRASGASLQVQSFVDVAGRQEPVGRYDRRTFDVDMQYHTAVGTRHDLVAGAGYRFNDERFEGHGAISLIPAHDKSSTMTAFVQDEIAMLGNRLAVTLGSQAQYDSNAGAGVQPTARAMWKATARQRLWIAASRALRTPSLAERGIRVVMLPVPVPGGLPLTVTALGNPAAETENFVDAEVGYRLELGTTASIDVTGFVGRYDHLRTEEVSAPLVEFVPSPRISVDARGGNLLEATTHGLEVAGHWMPVPSWRLDASYSTFHLTPKLAAASLDPEAAGEDGSAPGRQWQLQSAFSPSPRATLNVAIFHAGALEGLLVKAYTRTDITAEWRLTPRLSVMAIGHNLFHAAHPEFLTSAAFLRATEVARSASLRLRWSLQ
jgi:iron complex outermembrane receptor protein